MNAIAKTEVKVLLALAKYKFLSTSQILKLSGIKHKSNLLPILARMRDGRRATIGRVKTAVHPKIGKLEDVYYLSRWGVKILTQELGVAETDIKYPRGAIPYLADYFHRLMLVEFEINIDFWANENNFQIDFFERYFDRNDKIKIYYEPQKYILTDAIFLARSSLPYLYTVEIYLGDYRVNKIINQIKKHCLAMANGEPSQSIGIDRGNQLLVIVDSFTLQERVRAELSKCEELEGFGPYILFKTLPLQAYKLITHYSQITQDWVSLDSQIVNLKP